MMDVKKSPQAELSNRSGLYFLIGLNVILLITLLALEFSRKIVKEEVKAEAPLVMPKDENVIITDRQFDDIPPPPVDAPPPPKIPVDVKVVNNDVEIKKPIDVQDQKDQRVPPPDFQKGSGQPGPPGPPPAPKPTAPPTDNINNKVTRATAKKAMVYPGCEKYEGDNRQLYDCFNKLINTDIASFLNSFEMEDGERPRKVSVGFEIDKSGNLHIKEINPNGAEQEFVDNSKQAFQRLADMLERKAAKGKGIKPALNSEDQPAVMEYSIRVSFVPEN